MKEGTIAARELVERLWIDPPEAPPPPPDPVGATLGPNDHIVHRPDLAFLNRSWVWSNGPDGPGGDGFAVRLRRWLRSRFARLILTAIDRYLHEERAFVEHLVRFQNQLAEKSDQLSDEIREVDSAERSLAVWTQDRLDELSRRTDLLHGLLEARVRRLEASATGEREPSR